MIYRASLMLRIQVLVSVFFLICGLYLAYCINHRGVSHYSASSYEPIETSTFSFNIGNVQLMGDILFRGKLSVKGPLDRVAIHTIRTKNVSNVHVLENADESLFSDKTLFPKLNEVHLNSNQNGTHLKLLAKNYPNTSSIVISQKEPLKQEEYKYLNAMKNLNMLYVYCPVEAPSKFLEYLPKSIYFLQLMESGVCTSKLGKQVEFPKLNELRIDEPLDNKFLLNLDAPELRTVYVSKAIDNGGLVHIPKFEKLESLHFNRGDIVSYNELVNLRDQKLPKHLSLSCGSVEI